MDIHYDRLKALARKRSIGGWLLWVVALGWKRLGDWQNVEWLGNHAPKGKAWFAVPHPDSVRVVFFIAGLAWFTAVLVWPKTSKEKAITGSADLLIHRLKINDLKSVATDWSSYQINLGVFVRAVVWVLDKPRTIRSFVLELTVDGRRYSAESEREIGDYTHRYKQEEPAQYGYGTVVNDVDEDMESLISKTQTPLLPETHAEGWLHFELQNVNGSDELRPDAAYHLYALDAKRTRYELDTRAMNVRLVDSHEYAWSKRP